MALPHIEIDSIKSELSTLRDQFQELMGVVGQQAKVGAERGMEMLDEAGVQGKRAAKVVYNTAEEYPLATLAVVFGLGLLIGKMMDRD